MKTKSPSTDRLQRLREVLDIKKTEAEIASYESQIEAHRWAQSGIASESYTAGELVNRGDWRAPEIQRSIYGTYDSTMKDRRHGRNEPFVQSEYDVNVIRGVARLVCEVTTTGKSIERNLKNYVVGFGLNHEVVPKRPKDLGPDGLKEDLQEFIDFFLESNKWDADLDRELFWRNVRDGERFVPTYPQRDGSTKVRQIEPEQVQQPPTPPSITFLLEKFGGRIDPEIANASSDWTFGIHTAEHDVQTAFGYCIRWDADSDEGYLPESHCLHSKRNVDRNIKRGMSDFYPAWKKILSQDKLENRTGSGSAARAGIAYIVAHAEGTTATEITAMNQANSVYNRTRTLASGTTEEIPVQEHEGATRLDVDKGREYLQSMVGTDPAVAAIEVMQALARSIGKVWSMPEHMISGDASNNNFASIKEAGTPFSQHVSYEQWSYAEFKKEIIWRAVKHAASCGRFDRWGADGTYRALKRRFDCQITPPDFKEGNRLAETQRRQILKDAGVITLPQWQIEEGYDPDEQAAMQAEDATDKPSGEFGALGRRQFTNNTKAVDDVLSSVRDGSRSVKQADQLLQSLGLSASRAAALLQDDEEEGEGMIVTGPRGGRYRITASGSTMESVATYSDAIKVLTEGYP